MPPPSPLIIAAGIAAFTAALMLLLMAMPVATASAADSPLSMDSTKSADIALHDAESASDDEIAPQRRRRGTTSGLVGLIVANWEISLIIGGLLAFAILITMITYNHHRANEQSDRHPDE